MKKLLLFILVPMAMSAQKDNIFSNTADAAKMAVARQKLYGGDVRGALNSYREIEGSNPNDASVKYWVGYCYFLMGDINAAKTELEKAVTIQKDIKPQTYLVLGEIHHMQGNLDQAIEQLNKFKDLNAGDDDEKKEGALHLAQCQTAKSLMGSPYKVNISALPTPINSVYDDKNPCVTADGRMLVFTTRRPEHSTDPVDEEGDGKYFENVFMVVKDSTGKFGAPQNMGNTINTKGHDACTSISADGSQIFLYKNDMHDKAAYGGNVFYSRKMQGKWKHPESLGKPINTSYWEGGACISADGKRLFFSSERPGGLGHSDIWMSEKNAKKEWGEPVNLGSDVNTEYDEAGMFLAPDGKTLFFCSNGPNSMGSYDIFKTVYENGKWSKPENVGYPINTPNKEGQFTLSADGHKAFFSSNRPGGVGENDIYIVDLMDYAILEKDGKYKTGGLSILKGTIRDGFEGYGIADADVTLLDESGKVISSTNTNDAGEYFFTLDAGKYRLAVKKKGYREITEPVELSKSNKETFVLEKGFLLNK